MFLWQLANASPFFFQHRYPYKVVVRLLKKGGGSTFERRSKCDLAVGCLEKMGPSYNQIQDLCVWESNSQHCEWHMVQRVSPSQISWYCPKCKHPHDGSHTMLGMAFGSRWMLSQFRVSRGNTQQIVYKQKAFGKAHTAWRTRKGGIRSRDLN